MFIPDLDLTMTPISMIIAVQRLSCLKSFGCIWSLPEEGVYIYIYLVNLLSINFCHVSRFWFFEDLRGVTNNM